MLLYFILSLVGCIIGIILAVTAIIFRKRIEPSVMMAMIFLGGLITIGCIILITCFAPFVFGFSLQK